MTKLDAALLKLEGALDYTVDPQVRTLIDIAQQAIEAAKHVMEETAPIETNVSSGPRTMQDGFAYVGGYQRAA
ncbi:MAG TPA: hypothetical protein VN657_11650 [Nitrospiraceae bacterium]|jgi:hypothetical protein|nr:hypothetical protein [Nitrospiraceae bacterium]